MRVDERPPVTVALPVYNGARFVTEAIRSVLDQRGWDVHLVVVDDCSTDGSRDLLRGLAAQDARITLLENPVNVRAAAARNRAIALRDDPLIAFIDCDDLWTPDRLDVAWRALAEDPELDFVLAHQRFLLSDGVIPSWFRPRWMDRPQPAYLLATLLAWRARTWDVIGGLDESLHFGDDTDWFVRARDRGLTHRVLPEVLLERRIHRDNWSGDPRRPVQDLFTILRRRHRAGEPPPTGGEEPSR